MTRPLLPPADRVVTVWPNTWSHECEHLPAGELLDALAEGHCGGRHRWPAADPQVDYALRSDLHAATSKSDKRRLQSRLTEWERAQPEVGWAGVYEGGRQQEHIAERSHICVTVHSLQVASPYE